MFVTTNPKFLNIFISAIESQNGNKSFQLTRPKRQTNSDPKTHLDAQITYLLGALPFQIDLAEETIEKNVKFFLNEPVDSVDFSQDESQQIQIKTKSSTQNVDLVISSVHSGCNLNYFLKNKNFL